MGDADKKPPGGGPVSTGVYDDPEALDRAEDLVGDKAEPEVSGPPNSFRMPGHPMIKMCYTCGFMHRDMREGATPDDSSTCAKCIAKGIAEPARYLAPT